MATPAITWSYYTGSEWTAISGYVLTKYGCSGFWGMGSNKHTDRIARTGEMRVVLNNTSGCFDPEDTDALTGWGINTKIKLEVTFDGTTYRRFYGTVQNIKFSDPNSHEHTATVTVADWMRYAYKFLLTDPAVEANKRGGYAVDAIVDDIGQAPLNTNYSQGDYEYDAIFDSVTVNTKAATELNKIVMSEFGYFYNRHDKVYGETLTFEAGSDRGLTRTISQIPKMVADCGYILQAGSATDKVLDTSGNNIVAAQTQDAHINGFGDGFERSYGANILNNITVTAYPKRVDSTEQTLYSLGTYQKLSAGETKTIKAKYQNLTTKESCNAITSLMIQPVATTDYTMFTNSDGSGTNLTANLTVVAVYKAAEVELTLTNSSVFTGYINLLKCRGYGIYQDSSVKTQAESITSQSSYSDFPMNIEQRYQRDTVAGEEVSWKLLTNEYLPRTKLERVSIIANKSNERMLAFLAIDIGDMVKITESDLGIDDYYYVQGIEFSISAGNLIAYDWILKEVENLSGLYTDIILDYSNASDQKVTFNNNLPDMSQKTVMFRFDLDSFDSTASPQYIAMRSDAWVVYLGTSSEKIFFLHRFTGASDGLWAMDPSSFTTGLHHVAVTFDAALITNNPILYLDGSSVTVNEIVTPVGTARSEDSVAITIGGWGAGKSPNGNVYNLRIYNRILSALEIAAEEATPGTVTDGLVFSGPAVYTVREAEYDNLTLTSDIKVFDTVNGLVGTPTGSPISQLIP